MKNLVFGAVLGLLAVCFCQNGADAQSLLSCKTTPPECEDLGYIMTQDECSGLSTLPCPWDTSKVFCNVTCEDLGYSKKILVCGGQAGIMSTVYCPMDSSYRKCKKNSANVNAKCEALGYVYGPTGSCLSPKVKETCPGDSDYFKCVDRLNGDPVPSKQSCADLGYINYSAACKCSYGYKDAGVTGSDGACYRCGTQSECVVGGRIMCMKCYNNNLPSLTQ